MLNIALIGLGQRGQATLQRLSLIEHANVCVYCDQNIAALAEELTIHHDLCTTNWQKAIMTPEVDLVWICTPWEWHFRMAVFAMENGKDVALEVPAAMTVRECKELVNVSLRTGRECIMLENCLYDTWHLGAREMFRQGLLGRIKHLEGAYAHYVDVEWMRNYGRRHAGNPYPTHAIGPMCQFLRDDDSLQYLVSMSSRIPGDHSNTTLLRSRQGVSMMLHYDISTHRPYNRMQTVCGIKGFLQKYPLPTVVVDGIDGGKEKTGDEATAIVESFIPVEFQSLMKEGKEAGSPNLMNYMMDRRLVDALDDRKAHHIPTSITPLDTNVYDAALWSSIIDLTARSAGNGSERIEIPEF